jgi:hypothetical protein
VEITLDQCVQRLRSRIAQEQAQNLERFELFSGKKMDRTPSFYTTRSIVNLSGLSVSDPVLRPDPLPTENMAGRSETNATGWDLVPMPAIVHDFGEDFNACLAQPASIPLKSDPDGDIAFSDRSEAPANVSVRAPRSRRPSRTQPAESQGKSEGGNINKTTNMANFYYKHDVGSQDKLAKLAKLK